MGNYHKLKSSWHSIFLELSPEITIAAIFLVVYAFSLSFVYVEGDDATSVLYHAMGRNSDLQPPYSPYHGMMDVLLSAFPTNETILRHVAIAISAVFAMLVIILISRLIRMFLPEIERSVLLLINITILLCIPEIFYLGLIYTPSLVALGFVLTAHLLVRSTFSRFSNSAILQRHCIPVFLLSLISFGIGVACRWDIGSYLLVIAADLALNIETVRSSKRTVLFALFWTFGAIMVSLFAITVSGYGIIEFYQVLKLAKTEILNPRSWFAVIGAYQTFVTPGFLIFFFTGCCVFAIHKRRLLVLVLLGILPILPYLHSREPKMILPALPGICFALAAGIDRLWFLALRKGSLTSVRTILTILILAPWLLGLQVSSAETSWGPGFEVSAKLPNSLEKVDSEHLVADMVSDRRVSITDMKVALDGGTAIPTPEGPRPVGGHAFVLFGGEWRKLVVKLDDEREMVATLALSSELNILQDEGSSLIISKLVRMGFNTNDRKGTFRLENVSERLFTDAKERRIKVQILRTHDSLFRKERIQELIEMNPSHKVILYSGYSSTFRKLLLLNPRSIHVLGPFSGLLDLDELSEALGQN